MAGHDGGDTPSRLVAAAIARGLRSGVGALSIQGIAEEAGLSKALVLYHFDDKVALLRAVVAELVARDIAAIEAAAREEEPLEGWRRLASDTDLGAQRRLLLALEGEEPLRAGQTERRAARLAAATALSAAMLASAGMQARIAPALLGTQVLAQLDGLSRVSVEPAATPTAKRDSGLELVGAALDAFALALLSLGE